MQVGTSVAAGMGATLPQPGDVAVVKVEKGHRVGFVFGRHQHRIVLDAGGNQTGGTRVSLSKWSLDALATVRMTARPEPAALQSHGSSRLGDVPGLPRYVLAPWIDAEALVSAPPIELDDVAQFEPAPVGAKLHWA